MIGAPPTRLERMDQITIVADAVRERENLAERRWGIGRLPRLVPIDLATKFHTQARKFNASVWDGTAEEARRHGDAMMRAYDALEAAASSGGHSYAKPEVWEMEVDGKLVLLIRDKAEIPCVNTQGRECQVWSLDEVASVIGAQEILIAAKAAFEGATIEGMRPAKKVKDKLDDSLADLPF